MEPLTTFFTGMAGSSTIEIIAFFLGIIAVALVMFRSIWNYPFGIAMVSLYGFIFFEAKLYSDMLLQVFFFGIQVYGWWYWLQGNMAADGHIKVRLLAKDHYKWYGGAALIGILALGTLMARFTDAALPYPDATTTVLSVIAQILLARRYLENWILWIVVNVMAIFIYNYKELYPTTVLYAIFLGMAVSGYFMWKKIWTERGAREGGAAGAEA
jgi:nicotinamide mononucleotide transporter